MKKTLVLKFAILLALCFVAFSEPNSAAACEGDRCEQLYSPGSPQPYSMGCVDYASYYVAVGCTIESYQVGENDWVNFCVFSSC